MRLPNAAPTSRPWRIHELTAGFRLEDVWELPTPGGPDDFPRLVRIMTSGDPSHGSSRAARTLWAVRLRAGQLLGWDDQDDGPGRPTVRSRLPADLRATPPGPRFGAFTPLYLSGDEFAAEIVNRTVHGILHLGWAGDQAGRYHGEMAVYVQPNGLLGTVYLATIRPFRHLIVYPAMLREIGKAWQAGGREPAAARR
jgi:hypothetical protein